MNVNLITHSIRHSLWSNLLLKRQNNTIDEYLECSCEYSIGLVEDADQEVSSNSKLPNLIQTDISFYLHLVHILELNSAHVQCIVQPGVTAAVFVRKPNERMFS